MKLYSRIFQRVIFFTTYFIHFRIPKTYIGDNVIKKVSTILESKKISKVLIVSDAFLVSTEGFKILIEALEQSNITYVIYDKTEPNPDILSVLDAYSIYNENHLKGIIAYGGGSPMDLAKGVVAKSARPYKSLSKMKGILKVLKRGPLMIAIPTTVGTGSEVTVAAVLSNKMLKEKYAIMDPVLIPSYALLDPIAVKTLPPKWIAETGMDALTHAVEAYLGYSNTKKTLQFAKEAIQLIDKHLVNAYRGNLDSLHQMQIASYKAGIAFTRAYVGNIHAIAHALGGFYQIPHGFANAVIMPHVLEYYGDSVEKKLAELGELIGLEGNKHEKHIGFINYIKNLNQTFNIPTTFNRSFESDLKGLVNHSFKDANPLYPVPVYFHKHDFEVLYRALQGVKS